MCETAMWPMTRVRLPSKPGTIPNRLSAPRGHRPHPWYPRFNNGASAQSLSAASPPPHAGHAAGNEQGHAEQSARARVPVPPWPGRTGSEDRPKRELAAGERVAVPPFRVQLKASELDRAERRGSIPGQRQQAFRRRGVKRHR